MLGFHTFPVTAVYMVFFTTQTGTQEWSGTQEQIQTGNGLIRNETIRSLLVKKSHNLNLNHLRIHSLYCTIFSAERVLKVI